MEVSGHRRWLRAAILFGFACLVAGLAIAALANASASDEMRFTWRLAAFVAGAAAFAVQIGYEHFRLNNSPSTTALHTSAGVALGAFALAAAANVRALWAGSSHGLSRAFALVVWPVLGAAIAFIAALSAAAVLARTRRRGYRSTARGLPYRNHNSRGGYSDAEPATTALRQTVWN